MTSLTNLMRRHGLTAHKSLGQNFLADDGILQKIVAAAGVTAADDALEIGPGLGTLTAHLARAARQVTAVELDGRLFPALRENLAGFSNVRLVQGDILQTSAQALGLPGGYVAAANVPYYITSAILRHLLSDTVRPRQLALTVQKEVAERVCASAGEMSLLALSVQVYGKPSIAGKIPAGAFTPAPKVDSAILRVEVYPQPLFSPPQMERFFELIRAGFSQKRKTLRNCFSAGLRISPESAAQLLQAAEIDPMRRAESLSLAEWGRLAQLSE